MLAPAVARAQADASPVLPSARQGLVPHVPPHVVLRVVLAPGDEIVAGTCGLPGASSVGDTTLELRGPSGARVAFDDDSCGSLGSLVRYVAPPGGGGTYLLFAGCYEGASCGGTVAFKVSAAPPTATSVVGRARPRDWPAPRDGSAPHVPRAVVTHVELERGERLVAGTCGLPNARHEGDTTLLLFGPSGARVGFNDDACGGLGSQLRYTAVEPGVHVIVAGCYDGGRCGGTVAYRVHDPLPPPPPVRITAVARGAIDAEGRGGALIADALLEVRWLEAFVLRLGGAPLALGGGAFGGLATGTMYLSLLVDLDMVAFGLGGGVSTLASRLGDPAQREVGVLSAHGRIGRLRAFHVEGRLATAWIAEDATIMSADVVARLPLRGFDVALRGAGGSDGTALGEAVVTVWLVSARSAPVFGLSVHAGGSGVFYQPRCRFGAVCDPSWYVGPHLGLGMEWRP